MNSTNPAYTKWVLIVLALVAALAFVLTLGLYDVIKIEWVSFMEIQSSYRPMEEPLPVAARSIPIEGAASIPGVASINPIPVDEVSVERGRVLFSVTCVICHGPRGKGNGIVGSALVNKPADLTGAVVQIKLDGDLFNSISKGIIVNGQIRMPALNENLTVRDRWDLVNFIRSLKAAAGETTPAPQP